MPESPRTPGRVRPAMWGPDAATATTLVWGVAVVWLVLKIVSVFAWSIYPGHFGDTHYYVFRAQEAAASGQGVAQAFREYPTPAGLLLLVPWAFGADEAKDYRAWLIVTTSMADAAFTWLLGRRTGPVGAMAWILFATTLGQLVFLRFDIFPAVVAGAGLLYLLLGRQVTASVLVALGTGLKLWPIVLAPLTIGRRGQRLRALLTFAVTGAGLVLVSLATGGWDRLLSPLDYQRDRGLQIESVPATAPMLRWSVGDPAYRVFYGPYASFEVGGPTVGGWLELAGTASLVGMVLAGLLLLLWLWRGTPPAAAGYLSLAFVGTFIVTSRALSPQYLIWLAAPTAVIVGLALRDGLSRRAWPQVTTFVMLLALCLLTLAIYPTSYTALWELRDDSPRTVGWLAWRNIGLVLFTVWAMVMAVRECFRPVAFSPVGPSAGGVSG